MHLTSQLYKVCTYTHHYVRVLGCMATDMFWRAMFWLSTRFDHSYTLAFLSVQSVDSLTYSVI